MTQYRLCRRSHGLLAACALVFGLWLGVSVTACTLLHASNVPALVRQATTDRHEVWTGIEARWPVPDDELRSALQEDSETWASIETQASEGAPSAFMDVVRSQKLVTKVSASRLDEFAPIEKLDLVRALRDVWARLEGYYQ
jgi:hypothetical protein